MLLDALLPLVRNPFAESHAVQLRGGTVATTMEGADINALPIASPFDTVADLLPAQLDTAAARFDWLLSLDTGALIDARQPKFAEPARLRSAEPPQPSNKDGQRVRAPLGPEPPLGGAS